MEQRKQPKRVMTARVSEPGYVHIKQRADEADVDVSHMVRRMLAYASLHMPRTWIPPREGR
jgi:hypothetical protein